MLPGLQAVLFDHDGTLVDSEGIHCRMWQDVLRTYGAELRDDDYWRHYAGVPSDANAVDAVARFALDVPAAALLEQKNAATDAYLARHAFPLMPGAAAALERFHQRGVRVGIVTGAARRAVEATVRGHFSHLDLAVVVSGDEVAASKPAPDVYLLALQRLGLHARACIAIEDTKPGLAAATAAGLACVAVPPRASERRGYANAAYVADDLSDAVRWIALNFTLPG